MGSRSKQQKRALGQGKPPAASGSLGPHVSPAQAPKLFKKPPLTFEEQADLLISRGLVCEPKQEDQTGRDRIIRHLKDVNYYHLSAYWYPLRKFDESRQGQNIRLDDFIPGSTFDQIWDSYVFDRRFRLLLMDAIERIEVSIRTSIVYHLVQKYGAFALYDYFPSVPLCLNTDRGRKLRSSYDRIVLKLKESFSYSKEDYALHYRKTYVECQGENPKVPFWVACELMSLGDWSWLFDCMALADKRVVAEIYGLDEDVLSSWLRCLKNVRNFCAHHGRIWNRVFTENPRLQKNYRALRWPTFLDEGDTAEILNDKSQKNRVYAILCICNYLLHLISPGTEWKRRVLALVMDYQEKIPVIAMGFPVDWKNRFTPEDSATPPRPIESSQP